MVLRAALLSLIVLGVAGLGGLALVALRPPPPAAEAPRAEAPAPPARVAVLVAARPLRAGSFLRAEDLTARELPEAEAAGTLRDTPQARAEVAGAMLRRPAAPGAPLLPEDVLRPGDRGFLAVLLAPGTRAATIGVDAVSGAAGLVWPGDLVDVLLTQQIGDEQMPLHRRVAAETVLSGARVLAIDQAIVQGAVAGENPAELRQRQDRTVTLEVSPMEAERLSVAARLGRLSLTVVAAQPAAEAPPPAPVATWAGDVSSALRVEPQAAPPPPRAVNVHLGSGRREEFRF
jgi:pilus assembly protein CpaB